MEDTTAVTRIGNQNFKVLSCFEAASFKDGKAVLNSANIQRLIEPLIWEGCHGGFIKSLDSKIKSFVKSLFDKPDGIHKMGFKDENNQDYTALCHKFDPLIFAFILQPLSDEALREIEKNSTGKTYLTGDFSDMFKTKKDMH